MIELTGNFNESGSCYGWILYTKPESGRNRHYIELYKTACQKYGISIELGIYEPGGQADARMSAPQWSRRDMRQLKELLLQSPPLFVINRTRNYKLSRALESLHVRVYNNSQTALLGNDKAAAYRYMQRHGIEIMPAAYGAQSAPKQYPVVVKPCFGHGGEDVFLLKSVSEWQEWKQNSCKSGTAYVIQQAASDLGRDLRVYVVGNRIAASVLRVSRNDFRSNFCLGGEASLYELNSIEKKTVEEIMSHFQIGMAGIDFIFHHGRMVFNEIEDMAGARMLYSLTNYDIVDDYVSFIRNDLSSG